MQFEGLLNFEQGKMKRNQDGTRARPIIVSIFKYPGQEEDIKAILELEVE